MPLFGYHGKLLFVDLTDQSSKIFQPDECFYRLHAGGGLMGTALMLEHTVPGLDAFDPANMLIFVSGVVAGHKAPGLARFSVVTKSPLSGGIAEARGEGAFGMRLKQSGFDAICITGCAQTPVTLVIEQGSMRIEPAEALWSKADTLETARYYEDALGVSLSSTAAIGCAGEKLVRYANIVTGGANHAARLGTGAVMGSKKLKALVIKGSMDALPANPEVLESIRSDYAERMLQNTLSMWQKQPPGFSASADLSDFDTAYIGACNYTDDLQVSNSSFTRQNYLKYYKGEQDCPDCPSQCMKQIGLPEDNSAECSIHQEITGALGANIGNKSLELVLSANRMCNLYGLDPVSLGFSISFAMECRAQGLITESDCDELAFGKDASVLPLIERIARREGEFGSLLGEGVRRASAQLGEKTAPFAMHVKGVEMVSFEPRTQTNLALGYAVAPIGPRYDICEHDWDFDIVSGWEHTLELSRTLGIGERVPMQELSLKKTKNFHALYTLWSACDAMNLCIFASAPTRVYTLENISKLISAITDWKTSSYEFMRYGSRRNTLMRLYNVREGFSAADDMLPDRFFSQPVSFGRLKGTCLDLEMFLKVRELWYGMCGWDAHGVPTLPALYDLELDRWSHLIT